MVESEFLSSTIGLMASSSQGAPKLVRAEFSQSANDPNKIEVRLVSGHSLGHIKRAGVITITRAQYEDRPLDPYDQVPEARWAFAKFGYEID